MANRPRGYGMTAEVKSRMNAKYDVEKEIEVRSWMEAVTGEPLSHQEPSSDNFHLSLKDGTYLCKLACTVIGAKAAKSNTSKLAFKQMENINNFLTALESYGVSKTDLFQTVDLYEKQNMWNVVLAILALGRKAQANGYTGPVLGPREATKNVREFSEDQMKAGSSVIGLQMGTNTGASQKGMSFGAVRHINDIKSGDASKESQGIISLQAGTNKGASQAGQNFGKSRGILGTDK